MRVRVSIGNLVYCTLCPAGEIDAANLVGILAPSAYKKGQRRYQPIGGAAELTEEGQKYLVESFGAETFHRSAEGRIDARFEVDDQNLDAIFDFFRARDSRYYEIDPLREVIDELTKVELKGSDFPEIEPVLSAAGAEELKVEYLGTVAQPFAQGRGTSDLAKEGVPSRRLFHHFGLVVSYDVLAAMNNSEAIRFLTIEEVKSTDGGAHKGRTLDGIELADNFIFTNYDINLFAKV